MCIKSKANWNNHKLNQTSKHLVNVLLASLSFGQGRRRSTASVSLCWVCVGAHWNTASARTSVVLCVFSVGKGVLSLPQEKRLHSQALDMLNSHMNVDKSIRAPSKHSGPFLLAWEAEVKGTRGGRGEVGKSPHYCENVPSYVNDYILFPPFFKTKSHGTNLQSGSTSIYMWIQFCEGIWVCMCLNVLLLISQVQDADGAQDLQLAAGQVEFDRVSFSYVPGCVANMFLMIITVVDLWFPPV